MTLECEEDVELGLPDGLLLDDEQADPFVTKIGGRPTWLRLTSVTEQPPICSQCRAPLYLLLQMDCPPAARASHVDRVFYVFGCNSRVCTESGKRGVVRVLVQCLQSSATATATATSSPSVAAPKTLWDSIMDVSAIANSVSSLSLEATTQEQAAGHFAVDYPCAFPATALHIVDELIAMHPRPKGKESRDPTRMVLDANVSGDGWQSEAYEKMHIAGYDKVFRNFHTRVAHYPRQCVRYCPGGNPLPFSADPIPEIPPCPTCSNPRRFELQLMPAILSKLPTSQASYLGHIPKHLRGKHPLYDDGMAWGTILVYSCGVCSLGPAEFCEFEGFAVVQIERDS